MTRANLEQLLIDTRLFTLAEAHKIVQTCGAFTVGNAIIACEMNGINLTGYDVEILISANLGGLGDNPK